MISNDNLILDGFDLNQWIDMLKTNRAKDAMKARNYYEGQQEDEVIKLLDDPYRGRANWRSEGYIPRFRNVTKMIVEKSGLLFKDAPPVLEVFNQNKVTPAAEPTTLIAEELAKVEWSDFAIKLDEMTRLLKTAIVLMQWDAEEQQIALDLLHRGNCEVVINPTTKKPRSMIYRYSSDNDGADYAIWTMEEIVWVSDRTEGGVVINARQPNPYGLIPITVFYDTNSPVTGFWAEQDKTIVNLNEVVNLHYTDSERSIKWSKMSTAITNMQPKGASAPGSALGAALGSVVAPDARTVLGGPGQVVVLESNGIDSPFFDYKRPDVDLVSLDDVVNTWVQSVAGDWSVKIHTTNTTAANSGFQLMVEEMANLDLRKQRQRMFEQSFKRFYRILARVMNTAKGHTALDESAEMFAKFSAPSLPVDVAAQEELWAKKISEGRATELDYFMKVEGMTKEEAKAKILEMHEFNVWKASLTQPEEPTADEDQDDAESLVEHDNAVTQMQSDSQANSQ
ncbi:hypothetical protein [Acidovorax sp.]|uniref:hypothetical protein n=1 Tax=Acidovorax sp. TaxID=1872122 RepID=UPI00391FBA96